MCKHGGAGLGTMTWPNTGPAVPAQTSLTRRAFPGRSVDRNHCTDSAGLHPEAGLAGKHTLAHWWGPGQQGPLGPCHAIPAGAASSMAPPSYAGVRPRGLPSAPNSRQEDNKASRSQDEKMKQVLGTLTSMPLKGLLKQEPRLRFFQEED
uniref:Uncharacterized protein n=1 Tax=Myotis myotis TaxID=51298 RepID=A0A7J7RHK3_MYOMY|nr:hypothetical protein mMyoMyo1_010313 [Myotis myotis]